MKELTVSMLEKDKDNSSVWVLNTSNPKGNINLTVSDGAGGNLTLVIPVTFAPIDLTTQATKQVILTSPQFRRLVSYKMITLISEEEALKRLEDPKVKKEIERIMMKENEHGIELEVPEIKSLQEGELGNVSGFAMNLANTEDLDEEQVLTTLMGNESSMTKEDMEYIANVSKLPKVKAYAASKVVEM